MPPSLDGIKKTIEQIKERAARVFYGNRAPLLIVLKPGESMAEAIQRVCGDEGLPPALNDAPHLFLRGVVPTKPKTEEDE